MGLMLAEPGFHTRALVEWEEYPRQSIIAAQRAGYFAPAPIWDDVTTFDGRPFRGAIDTILAGYPCQPFSAAGQRKGADDERHLWPDVARIIREVDPEWVFLENVAGHVSLGLETVLRDLWDMGRTPAVGLFSAGETGAPHERLRVFIVAHRNSAQLCTDGRQSDAGTDGRNDACRGGGNAMAHANGRNPGAEWQQRGGQFGLHAEDGCADRQLDNPASARCDDARRGAGSYVESGECLSSAGCGDVVHSERPERRPDIEGGHVANRDDPGRDQTSGWSGKPSGPVGHPAGLRRGEGRSEPSLRGGRDTPASAGGAMADAAKPRHSDGRQPGQPETNAQGGSGMVAEPERCGGELADASGAGPQGREWHGPPDQRHGASAHGSVAERGRPRLFPPGPSDMAGWSDTLAIAPYLAPAAGLGDCLTWAANVAQALEIEGEAAVESRVRRMAHGLAARSRALRLLGNGVCPLAAGYAWRTLANAHGLGALDLETHHRGAASGPDGADMRAAE